MCTDLPVSPPCKAQPAIFPSKLRPYEKTWKTAKEDAKRLAGSYELSRRSESNFLLMADVFGEFKVSTDGDGMITVDALKDLAGYPIKWREVAPNVWREVNGPHTLIATYRNGKLARIDSDEIPPIPVASPASFWRMDTWNLPLLIAAIDGFRPSER